MAWKKIGFFDAVTYYVGVSGSTWLTPWFVRPESLQGYQNLLIPKLDKKLPNAFVDNAQEVSMLFKEMYLRHAYRQPWTGVNLYGAGLTNVLLKEFGDRRQQVYLSEVMKNIANGSRPFPILTAVGASTGYGEQWFEFTPAEVGSPWLNMYVPTWSFGSKFQNGHMIEAAPEYPLGFFMGTCGSAFAINNKELYDMALRRFVSSSKLDKAIQGMLQLGWIGDSRITDVLLRRASRIRNYTRGIAQSPLRDERTFALRDAGLHYNFDINCCLRKARGVNILVILDASGGAVAGELRKAERDAHKKGIPFPYIDYNGIDKKTMSVFKDVKNPNAPLVIYFPRIINKEQLAQAEDNSALAGYVKLLKDFDINQCIQSSFCNTFNFKYTAENARQLMALSEFNMVVNAERLKKEIVTWVYERYPQLKK